MGNPRTPKGKAEITGACLQHPERYAARYEPYSGELPPAPPWLAGIERQAWEMFRAEVPWLARSDSALVEIACRLRARLMADPDMGANAMAQLRLCLSSMGATPRDRERLSLGAREDFGPASEFLQ